MKKARNKIFYSERENMISIIFSEDHFKSLIPKKNEDDHFILKHKIFKFEWSKMKLTDIKILQRENIFANDYSTKLSVKLLNIKKYVKLGNILSLLKL